MYRVSCLKKSLTLGLLLLLLLLFFFFLQAYRLEPLILKHYSTVKPLVIHSYESVNKTPYTKMETRAYAAFQSSTELLDSEKVDISDKDSVDSGGSSVTKDSSPSQKRKLTFKGEAQTCLNLFYTDSTHTVYCMSLFQFKVCQAM